MCSSSVGAGAYVLGQADQGGGADGVVVLQLRDGLADEVLCNLLGLLQAQQGGVRRLAGGYVLASCLALWQVSATAMSDASPGVHASSAIESLELVECMQSIVFTVSIN